MGTPNPAAYTTNKGFFGHASKETNQPHDTPQFVNVGGCGFRAIAASMVDSCLGKRRLQTQLVQTLLQHHIAHFPAHDPIMNQGLTTPNERFEKMVQTLPTRELVQSLAYTLRQMAVDELERHPAKYRGAFIHKNELTSPNTMRQAKTWIDESAIVALSNALNLPIEVLVVENNKPLPLRLKYNANAQNPKAVLRLHDEHYIPYLKNPSKFHSTLIDAPIEPVSVQKSEDTQRSLDEILKVIKEDDQNIKEIYEACLGRLNAMHQAGELNQETLLKIYIENMNTSDYLEGRVHYVGTELGHQHFFALLHKQTDQLHPMSNDEQSNNLTKELIYALSRAASIGHINLAAALDKTLEPPESSSVNQPK